MNGVIEPFDAETGELLPEAPREAKPAPPQVEANIAEAIHALIAELPIWITRDDTADVLKDGKKLYSYKYATLKAIMSVVRPLAMKHGIRIRQGCEHAWQLDTAQGKGRMVPVFTDLIHTKSGQIERTTIEIPIARLDAQGMGSAISFGRRYGILAALGLVTDEAEDDGAGTKRRDITDEHEASQELWLIREEIASCDTLNALNVWGKKASETGRVEKLSDAEAGIARIAFSDRLRTLRYVSPKKEEKPKA